MNQKPGEILNFNIDELFEDDPVTGTPPVNEDNNKVELTAAMSKRINEVRAKTEAEVRDNIAKDLGFDSYDEMQKAKDKKFITEAGFNPEDVEKIIEPMLEKRLANDPRMQKLQQYEEQEKKAYINSQLAEIEKLTGLKVTETDLPKETLDLWGKGVDLANAYIATNPTKIISNTYKGSTAHLASSSGAGQPKSRGLTADEKALYKSINPSISEEELNKKTIEVK